MKYPKKSYLLVFALSGALFAGACSRISGPNDQEIVTAIQSKLYQNPDLKALSVNVASEKGVVTLSGQVNAPLERLAVEDLAEKTPGVKQVVDQLTVAAAAQPPASGPAKQEEASARRPARHHRARRLLAQASEADPSVPEDAQNAQNNAPAPAQAAQAQPSAAPQPPAAAVPAPAPAHAAAAAPAPPPPPKPAHVTIPSGTVISVRMVDPISSQTAQAGQTYAATVFAPVVVGQRVVVPQGADATVRVVEVRSAGHYQGQSELQVELVSLKVNGSDLPVQTGYYTRVGASRGKNTAEKVGGGAALGALLGAVLGHGKGAGIGAGVGGAAGGIDQAATHGQQVTIPSEAKIDFVLRGATTVTMHPTE
ncbi:MAG: BON domain-containing protein [Terriglobia bacterium]